MKFDEWWDKYKKKHVDWYIYEKDVRAAYVFGTNKVKQSNIIDNLLKENEILRNCVNYYADPNRYTHNCTFVGDDGFGRIETYDDYYMHEGFGHYVGGKSAVKCLEELDD